MTGIGPRRTFIFSSDGGTDVIRTVAYVAHVLSGAFWTGAVLLLVDAALLAGGLPG